MPFLKKSENLGRAGQGTGILVKMKTILLTILLGIYAYNLTK